jgi:hypothetical protein
MRMKLSNSPLRDHVSTRTLRAGRTKHLALSALGVCAALSIPGTAAADGDIRAAYAVTFAGLPFANATLDLALRGSGYTARVAYRTAGASRLLSNAAGSAASSGAYKNGRLVPSAFDLEHRNGQRRQKVSLGMTEGAVKTMTVDPPLELTSGQLPIEPKHLTAIADPLSALLISAVKVDGKSPASPCDRTLSVVDGLRRYDARLEPQSTGNTTMKGFAGPTTICRVALTPVAGMIGGSNSRLADAGPIDITFGRANRLDLYLPISLQARTGYGAVSVVLTDFADDVQTAATPRPN